MPHRQYRIDSAFVGLAITAFHVITSMVAKRDALFEMPLTFVTRISIFYSSEH